MVPGFASRLVMQSALLHWVRDAARGRLEECMVGGVSRCAEGAAASKEMCHTET